MPPSWVENTYPEETLENQHIIFDAFNVTVEDFNFFLMTKVINPQYVKFEKIQRSTTRKHH